MHHNNSAKKSDLVTMLGPVLVSASSAVITTLMLQPLACFLHPTFTLLANRGTGKIAFSLIVVVHLIFLAYVASPSFFAAFWQANITFLRTTSWIRKFFLFFALFFGLHIFVVCALGWAGYLTLAPVSMQRVFSMLPSLALGFVATFFLAWSEEAIFRGALLNYLRQSLNPFSSVIVSALIFMLAHNLLAPYMLISADWRLGVGLFLLGTLLAQLYCITNKLYVSMGAHAGLVFVKVILRRLPLVHYTNAIHSSFWVAPDLRQSIMVHILFSLLIIIIFMRYRAIFFASKKTLT